MKLISKSTLVILLALCAVSCHKHEEPPHKAEVEQHDFTEFSDAGAYYYGEYNGEFNMFCTYLLAGRTRIDDMVISGVGTALWLDMNVEINADNTIESTVYVPARDDASTVNAFLKGSDNPHGSNIPAGSYVYYHPLSGAAQYKRITNGQVTFSEVSSGKYRISAEVIADGEKYTFDYFGYFAYSDVIPSGPDPVDPVDPVDPETSFNWVKAQVEKIGTFDMGEWNKDLPTDYCDWKLMIGDKNYDFNNPDNGGNEIEFELITSASATDFTGTYTVLTEELNSLEQYQTALVAGSCLCGYYETDENDINHYYGTWLFPEKATWLGATEGTVKITKNGDTYTVVYDFADSWNEGAKFSGSYSGKITRVGTKATAVRTPGRVSGSAVKSRVKTLPDRIAVTAAK